MDDKVLEQQLQMKDRQHSGKERELEPFPLLFKCTEDMQSQRDEVNEANLDTMSNGEEDNQEEVTEAMKWEHDLSAKKKNKKKAQVQATKQSTRLKGMGGITIEELGTKRKKRQNLEVLCSFE
jgi:hypothetical protein